MKQIALILFAVVMVATFTTSAQGSFPKFDRYTVVPAMYELTETQMKEYDQILDFVEQEVVRIKKQVLTKEEKEKQYKTLSLVFREKVRPLFSAMQYKKWISTHGGYPPARPYIEDMGMTLEQYGKFKEYTAQYKSGKVEVYNTTQSRTARSLDRKKALEEYRSALLTLVSSDKVDYIIEQNLLLNDAANLTRGFSLLSEYKAVQYALAHRKYTNAKQSIMESDIPKDEKRKARRNLDSDYEKELRMIMTDEEYIDCIVYDEVRKERSFLRVYKITKEQYNEYIGLQKKKAIADLQVREMKISRTDKQTRIKENELKFREGLQAILTLEQYQMWLDDHQK